MPWKQRPTHLARARRESGKATRKRVMIGGKLYESLAAASVALSISVAEISRRIRSDRYPDFTYADVDDALKDLNL